MRKLVAAAVPVGATVMVPLEQSTVQIFISSKLNSTPVAGRIVWFAENGDPYEVGAATRVEVVSMPE